MTAYGYDLAGLTQDGDILGGAPIYVRRCGMEPLPFFLGWTRDSLKVAWRVFKIDFRTSYSDGPESNRWATFDAMVVLTLTVMLGEAAWETIHDIP